jgi:hydrogenase-4 component B
MVLLATGAAWSLLAARWGRAALGGTLIAIVAAGMLCALAAFVALSDTPAAPAELKWAMPLGKAILRLDALSAWFLLAIGLLSAAVAVYSWGYMQGEIGHQPVGAYGALLCMLVAALVTVVCAADAVLFLVGWELMALSSFFLIGFHDREPEARRGAWMYLIATHLGTVLAVFPMFAILYARAGSTSFDAMAAAAAAAPIGVCVILFVLGLIGFGVKAGFMPFHIWLPLAHPVAPSPVSALMSGVVIKTGIYGLIRLLTWLPPLPAGCAAAMIAIGAITGVMGILYALSQRRLKRMLAYSSVENIGIIGLGIGIAMLGRTMGRPIIWELGLAGALLHTLNHSLMKGVTFLSAGVVLHGTGTGDMERLGGLAKKTPANAAMFLLGAAAICALPPLNGFVGEWLIYGAMFRTTTSDVAFAAGLAAAAIAALALIGGLALAGFARVFGVIFLGTPRDASIEVHPTPKTMLAGMALPAAGCVVIGVAPWLPLAGLRTVISSIGATGEHLAAMASPLASVTAVVGLLVLLGILLALLRTQFCQSYSAAESSGTWGCGFARPTARMQYSASSFGWSLVESFRAALRPRRTVRRPSGNFPQGGELETHTPDVALSRGYAPLFEWIARMFQRLWPLQHGRIHLYLTYIVATLMVVFLVEAYFPPYAKPRQNEWNADVVRESRHAEPLAEGRGRR